MTEIEKQIKNYHQEKMCYNNDFDRLRKKLNLNRPFKSKKVYTIKIVMFIFSFVILSGIFYSTLKSTCDNNTDSLLEDGASSNKGETLYERLNNFINKIAYDNKTLTEENTAYSLLKDIADFYVDYTVYSDSIKENLETEFYLGTNDDEFIICSKVLVRKNDCNIIITCNDESKIINAELINGKMLGINKYFIIEKCEDINISIEYIDSTGYKEEVSFIINASEVLEAAIEIK